MDKRPATAPKKDKKEKKYFTQIIYHDWCKSCGLCVAFCPRKVIGRDKKGSPIFERPEECIGCRFCELHCPDFAITVKERNDESRRNTQ